MITVTLTFENEAALMAHFAAATGKATPPAPAPAPAPEKEKVKPAPKAEKAEKPAPAATPSAPADSEQAASTAGVKEEPAAEPSAKPVTLEDVRATLAKISQAGKADKVRGLIESLGVAKLTDVPADKYGELLEKAATL